MTNKPDNPQALSWPEQARELVADAVRRERQRQDVLWGGAEHDDGHGFSEWLAFVREEVDEVAVACDRPGFSDMATELVHVAAVASAWLESLVRCGDWDAGPAGGHRR